MFEWLTDTGNLLVMAGILAVPFSIFGVMSLLAFRRYRFIDGMVHGVIGRMGSGKSLYVTQRVLVPVAKRLRNGHTFRSSTNRPVRRIVTLTGFRPPYKGVEVYVLPAPTEDHSTWDELKRLSFEWAVEGDPAECDRDENGVCMFHDFERDGKCWHQRLDALVWLDEMHMFAGSQKMRMEDGALWACSMMRKLNAEMWWASQSEMKVHKRLRDDSSFLWRVKRYRGPWALLLGPNFFRAVAHDPETTNIARERPIDVRWYRLSRAALRRYNSFQIVKPNITKRRTTLAVVGREGVVDVGS